MKSLSLSAAALTDIGCKRKNNEDSVLSLADFGVFCVADGMGGAREGQVASKALTDALAEAFAGTTPIGAGLPAKVRLARESVSKVNRWIKKHVEEHGYAQMGSTVVIGLFDNREPTQGVALHAGDSRMYVYRNRTLQQLTVDHSFVAELGAKNDKSLPSEFRGVVTKAVGLREDMELDETPFDFQPGDLFLLCSDGLTRMLADKFIQKLLRQNETSSPDSLARLLVGEAKKAGGDDNVSVVVIKAGQSDDADTEAPSSPTILPTETGDLDTAGTANVHTPATGPTWDPSAPAPAGPPAPFNDKSMEPPVVEAHTPHGLDQEPFPRARPSLAGRIQAGVLRAAWRKQNRWVLAGVLVFIGMLALQVGDKDANETKQPNDLTGPDEQGRNAPAGPLIAEEQSETAKASAEATEAEPGREDLLAENVEMPDVDVVVAASRSEDEPDMEEISDLAAMVEDAQPEGELDAESSDSGPVQVAEAWIPEEIHAGESVPEEDPGSVEAAHADATEEQETVDEARSRLQVFVKRAEDFGEWGILKEQMGGWWERLDEFAPDRTTKGSWKAWIQLWEKVDRAPDAPSVQSQLASFQKIGLDLNLDLPPPETEWKENIDLAADVYCRTFRDRQTRLLDAMDDLVRLAHQESAWFNPDQGGMHDLCRFVKNETNRTDCLRIKEQMINVGKWAKEVEQWVTKARASSRPIPPDQYPAATAKAIRLEVNSSWKGLRSVIQNLDSELERKSEPSLPNQASNIYRIESLRQAILKDQKSNRRQSGLSRISHEKELIQNLLAEVSAWLLAQDIHEMKTLADQAGIDLSLQRIEEWSDPLQVETLRTQVQVQESELLEKFAGEARRQCERIEALGPRLKSRLGDVMRFARDDVDELPSDLQDQMDQIHGKFRAIQEWAQEQQESDQVREWDHAPVSEIVSLNKQADEAWKQLFDMLVPLDQAIQGKKNAHPDLGDDGLTQARTLHAEIVLEYGLYKGDVRQWRNHCDVSRIARFLDAISGIVKSLGGETPPTS